MKLYLFINPNSEGQASTLLHKTVNVMSGFALLQLEEHWPMLPNFDILLHPDPDPEKIL